MATCTAWRGAREITVTIPVKFLPRTQTTKGVGFSMVSPLSDECPGSTVRPASAQKLRQLRDFVTS